MFLLLLIVIYSLYQINYVDIVKMVQQQYTTGALSKTSKKVYISANSTYQVILKKGEDSL